MADNDFIAIRRRAIAFFVRYIGLDSAADS
jgi:hypothetical protein